MKKIVIALIIALVVAAAMHFIIRNRDEHSIKKSLKSLAASVSKSKNVDVQGIAFFKKVATIKLLFSDDCTISVGTSIPTIHGIDDLIAFYTQGMRTVHEIKVTFHDISVAIGEDRSTAKTFMTAKATCPDFQEGGGGVEAREIEMSWKKYDRTWKIITVNEVKTLY